MYTYYNNVKEILIVTYCIRFLRCVHVFPERHSLGSIVEFCNILAGKRIPKDGNSVVIS